MTEAAFQPDRATPADAFIGHMWRVLEGAVSAVEHGFHWPTLGYQEFDGAIAMRTIVLRGVDASARTMTFFTDARSLKVACLSKNPKVSLCFVDRTQTIQCACQGTARMFDPASTRATSHFARLKERHLLDYATCLAPGTPIADLVAADIRTPGHAARNFMVVDVTVDSMDAVLLGAPTIRAKAWFGQSNKAQPASAQWVSP